MSLNNSRGRLVGISRELLRSWQETQEFWRDSKATEFDKTYMQPLFDAVGNTSHAMEELDKILTKLKDDCEIE